MKRRTDWVSLSATALAFAVTALVYSRLPDPIPVHWNVAGQPDGFAARWIGAFLLPLTAAGVYLLFELLPAIDPRRQNYEKFIETYYFLRRTIVLFMVLLHALTLYAILFGDGLLSSWLVMAAVGLMFVLIGNYLPRVRSNWFVGIRTPWTLSSEVNWRKTHRRGGQVFVPGGLILLAAAFLPAAWQSLIVFVVIALVAGLPILYSYYLFRQRGRSPSEKGAQG